MATRKPVRKPRGPSREWVEHTIHYHEQLAAGFRRTAERARSGRSTPEDALRFEREAARAEHAVEYWQRLLKQCRR